MSFRVLGPLEASTRRHIVDVRGPTQRTLLALLLLHDGQVLPFERLVDALWEGDPPASPKAAVHTSVYRLRRLLHAYELPARLDHEYDGYRLSVQSGELDRHDWDHLVLSGDLAVRDGRLEEAVSQMRSALALWRGPALSGIEAETVRIEAHQLDGVHDRVLDQCLAAELALGRHADVLPELEALVAMHPYHESWCAKLMIALYGSGQQAGALTRYTSTRSLLVDELGVEPGSELRRVHQAILAGVPPTELRP